MASYVGAIVHSLTTQAFSSLKYHSVPLIPVSLSPTCAWWHSLFLTLHYVQLRNNQFFSNHHCYFYDGNHHYRYHWGPLCSFLLVIIVIISSSSMQSSLPLLHILTLFLFLIAGAKFVCWMLSLLQIGTHPWWKSHCSRCMDERLRATLLTLYFQET